MDEHHLAVLIRVGNKTKAGLLLLIEVSRYELLAPQS